MMKKNNMEIGQNFKAHNIAFTEYIETIKNDVITNIEIERKYFIRGTFRSETKLFTNDLFSTDDYANDFFRITTVGEMLYFFESIKCNKKISKEDFRNLMLSGSAVTNY